MDKLSVEQSKASEYAIKDNLSTPGKLRILLCHQKEQQAAGT